MAEKIELPTTGVHVLPLLTAPSLKLQDLLPALVVIQMTTVVGGAPTEARCQIPVHREAVMQLVALLLDHAETMGWELPKGAAAKSTLQ